MPVTFLIGLKKYVTPGFTINAMLRCTLLRSLGINLQKQVSDVGK